MSFWADLGEALAPKENRLVAAVAAVRTFEQGLTGTGYISAGGVIVLTVTDFYSVDWMVVVIAAGITVLSALVSAWKAWRDVLKNGLPANYQKALYEQAQAQAQAIEEDRPVGVVSSPSPSPEPVLLAPPPASSPVSPPVV